MSVIGEYSIYPSFDKDFLFKDSFKDVRIAMSTPKKKKMKIFIFKYKKKKKEKIKR